MGEKSFRAWTPTQAYLLPPSPMDWLPTGHLAYFILEIVDELDLSKVEEIIRQKNPRGEPSCSPRVMTALVLYGYCVGVYSSRRIAQHRGGTRVWRYG
jgi:transposase